jgi:preprotein translocase subunit SecG
MNLAAIDWLSISINLLLVVFVIVCLLMILLVLMQRPKQEGLGAAFGAGVTDQVFGARTTNVLQRGTVYLGSLFFLLSLTLAVLIGHKNKKISMLPAKPPVAKVESTVPVETKQEPETPKSLSDELPKDPSPAKDVPPAPPIPADTPAKEAVPAPPIPADTPAKEAVPAPPIPADTPAKEAAPAPPAGTSLEKSGEP